jgi:enamine deaminase RidA (YjgF/YER057c/UK114 family)
MPQAKINPWKWQDQYGFSQAIEVSSPRRLLFWAGQIALDAEGKVRCAGDMRGQVEAAMNNVETVLAASGLSLANVVRLNFYTTDVDVDRHPGPSRGDAWPNGIEVTSPNPLRNASRDCACARITG